MIDSCQPVLGMGPSSLLFSRFACQTPLKFRFMFKSGQGVLLVSLLADSAGYARDKLPLKGPPQFRPPLKRRAPFLEAWVLFSSLYGRRRTYLHLPTVCTPTCPSSDPVLPTHLTSHRTESTGSSRTSSTSCPRFSMKLPRNLNPSCDLSTMRHGSIV